MDRYSYEGATRSVRSWPQDRLVMGNGYWIFDARAGHSPEQAIAETADRLVAEKIVAALNAAEARA